MDWPVAREILPRTLRGKLLAALIGLVTVTVTGVGIAVSLTSSQQVLSQMVDRVGVAGHVLDRFLQSRTEQLGASVRVLADDFGFRAAVATHDPVTIETAMSNQGKRIDADLVILLDPDGKPVSSTLAGDAGLPFTDALAAAREQGSAVATTAYDGALYQFFVAPVMAPDIIGWVVVAFAIDHAMAAELADLTGLEVSFLAFQGNGDVAAAVSTLPEDRLEALLPDLMPSADRQAPALPEDLAPGRGAEIRFTNRDTYLSAIRPLSAPSGAPVFAALQMPTRIISDTTALLLQRIVLVLAACLALATPIGFWLAHRISKPVRRLIASARKIERGDYATPVPVGGDGEVALLGTALATMQQGIRQREDHIRHQADHDDLTGLPNLGRLKRVWGSARRPYTLCMLSLTDLKDITFSFGYATGDALLKAVAERLRAEPQVQDLARVGGRNFAVILDELSTEAGLHKARQLREIIGGTYRLGERTVTCQVTCAVIGSPRDAADFATLYRSAEVTLEAARGASDGCAAFLPGREELRARQLAIIASFEAACSQNQFALHFQPKVHLASGVARECEALLRWQHPELGPIPPDEFILLAERSGNIRRVSEWVLEAAIAQTGQWHLAGLDMTVAVNLSAHDLADPNLAGLIEHTMRRHGVSGDRLVMEITESAVMRDRERAASALLDLRALGIRLSIDDFGTGHSSLAQLKQLPVDELKIDKSFVLELDRNKDDALIVSSTIELGHNLGLTVVAEGVEGVASLEMLASFRCDKAQGYHFSRPLPAADFEQWLRTANGAGNRRSAAS